jgi:hypothetical protein
MADVLNQTFDKPVIYLYPQETTDVSVSLGIDPDRFLCTYPEYDDGWNVTASPDGTLTDLRDGHEYTYLFWEASSSETWRMDEGFIVKGSDAAAFLREKLSYMGLLPREYNEFIVYWLPALQANEYNLIRFAEDDYTERYPLDINPAPDSVLRVFMIFREAEKSETVRPQDLDPFERKGFTVVEWGGTEIDAR